MDAYLPRDRHRAIAEGKDLPDRTHGSALMVDINGFTSLTEALIEELGPSRGADELTNQLNSLYEALTADVLRHHGSVVGFSGDAITCWFDHDDGRLATTCALNIQQTMKQFETATLDAGRQISLSISAGIANGPVRRFRIGDPEIQYLDILAGRTIERAAWAERLAQRGEVVVGTEILSNLAQSLTVTRSWSPDPGNAEAKDYFAAVTGLTTTAPTPDFPPIEEPSLTVAQVRPWLLPPVYERLQMAKGHFLAEIRPVVALFLKFGGLDYDQDQAAGKKLDAYIRWVQQQLARFEGYLIQLTIGDKGSYFYAVLGAPIAHDDDPVRAVAAALELSSPPKMFEFITKPQIGLSQGRMRVGAYGSSLRRTFGVLGNEVNMAARLMDQAAPGQILVSQRIADVVAKHYHLDYIGTTQIKGKKTPLSAFIVLGKRLPSLRRPAGISTSPLVGRESELAQLDQILTSVQQGGQVLCLTGGAGIGKSRLAAEFVERAQRLGFEVALGVCHSSSHDIAYEPWRQIFHAWFGLLNAPLSSPLYPNVITSPTEATLAKSEAHTKQSQRQIMQLEMAIKEMNPDWVLRLPLLGDLLTIPMPDNPTTASFEPHFRRQTLFALVIEIIEKLAQNQPLLLLIEDAHWLDEASASLTLALSQVLSRSPILLTLVHHPPSPQPETRPLFQILNRLPDPQHLALSELNSAGVDALVSNRLQAQTDSLALALIRTQAQGNPFFTEELVDSLRETGNLYLQAGNRWSLSEAVFTALQQANCLVGEGGQWTLAPHAQLSALNLGIPDSIYGIVLSRLDRLSETEKLTLKVASVIGRIFETDVLAQAHPLRLEQATLLAQLETLVSRDFIRLEGTQICLFKHHITQEVVYQTLPDAQLRQLHLAVGEALEHFQAGAVERLAYHFYESGVRTKALFYLDQAAHKLQREYANETALSYFSQALALEKRWEWLKGQVEILHILGRREDEKAGLKALANDPAVPEFQIAYLWSQYYEAIGDYPYAQTAIEQAINACRRLGDFLAEARCLTQRGLIAGRQGDYERAKDWYNRTLALLQGNWTYPDEEARILAEALNGLGTIHRQQGDFVQARTCFERALNLSRQCSDRQREAEAFNHLGATAFHQRNFAAALAYHQQALTIRQTIGDRVGEGTSLTNLAQVTRDAGDYGQSEKHLTAALTILQDSGDRWQEINVWNDLGILYQELGDLGKAQRCLQQGLKLAEEIGDEMGQAYLLSNLGLVTRDQGDLDTAERLLKEGLRIFQQEQNEYGMSFFFSYLSTVSLQAGRLEEAIDWAMTALDLRQQLDMRLNAADDLAILAKAHLMTGDLEQALNYAAQVQIILDESGGQGPEFPHRNYFIIYQVLSTLQQHEKAIAALQSAYRLVRDRADKIIDPKLRQTFLQHVPANREIIEAFAKHKAQL